MRFSLSELLLLVAIAAVGVPALVYAGPWTSSAIVMATAAVCVGMLIRACVDRGSRQAAAIGFAIASIAYFAVLFSFRSAGPTGFVRWSELDPYDGQLPTTRMARPLIEAAWSQRSYYVTPAGEKTREPPPAGIVPGVGFGGPTGWQRFEKPARADFMLTAQAFWAALFGYAGSKYAAWLYARRSDDRGADARPSVDQDSS